MAVPSQKSDPLGNQDSFQSTSTLQGKDWPLLALLCPIGTACKPVDITHEFISDLWKMRQMRQKENVSSFYLHSGGREQERMAHLEKICLMNSKICVNRHQSYWQQIITMPWAKIHLGSGSTGIYHGPLEKSDTLLLLRLFGGKHMTTLSCF